MSTKSRKSRKSLGRAVSDHNLKDDEPITETPTVAQNRSSDVIEYDPDKSVGDVLDNFDDDDSDNDPDNELSVETSSDQVARDTSADHDTFEPEADDEVEYMDEDRIVREETETYEESTHDSSDDSTTVTSASDGYFEDDEEWSASSDEILHSDEESVTAKQTDAVVNWDIDSLYTDEGKVRSKRSLKNSPPVLRISNSEGQSAEFVLTKNLSRVLANHLENTSRAYYGIRPKSEMSMKDKFSEAKTGLRENMGKAIIIGGLLAALVIFGIFF